MLPSDTTSGRPEPAVPQSRARPRPRAPFGGGLVAIGLVVAFVAGLGVGRLDVPIAPGRPPASTAPSTPAATATNGATATSPPSPNPAITDDPSTDEDDLALIREAWEAIREHYVEADELDDRELAYAAIDGLTEAVGDTDHTAFMTPEERAVRSSALEGTYVGIGAQVDESDVGLPLIIGVFRDSPADRAGLRTGDVVIAVDRRPTADEDLDTVIDWVRGEAGTAVVLTIRRGDGPERDIRIVRAEVVIEPVSWALVPGTTTAVLRLEQFSAGAAADLRTAIAELRSAGGDRVVFDLRGNPGGFVREAVAIGSEFLASGNVYVERNAAGEERPAPVTAGGTATDLLLVVLVDAASASAAEIVAGAIQDADRATVVGEQTFGTGTVLSEFPLSDGSALRIGTLEWLTPSGRVIWHEGIEPDVLVERPDGVQPMVPEDLESVSADDVAAMEDPQLARALELLLDE